MGYSQICFRIASGWRETEEPPMVLVRFEYLRSDFERRLLIGQFDLIRVKYVELESPDMFENRPRLLTDRGGLLFLCSKLGQNFSEMEVRTFVRIRRVIWDHLLVLRLKLSISKLYFNFRAEQLAKNNYELELIMQSALFFFHSRF